MLDRLLDWGLRRLLSIDRDASSPIFHAPEDGKKWTIAAMAYATNDEEAIRLIDGAFWPMHCTEAWVNTMLDLPQETKTRRARKGALKILWKLATNRRPLRSPLMNTNWPRPDRTKVITLTDDEAAALHAALKNASQPSPDAVASAARSRDMFGS